MRDEYLLFAAVVEAGSLSGAARTLGVSPAMVSKRLSALERRLGAQLIQRTTRRLVLTETGQAFHEQVVGILATIRAAEAAVTGRSGRPAGRLRVSAPTSFGRMHLAPRLQEFLDAYPEIVLEIDLTDAVVDLLAGRIDVAVRIGSPPAGGGLVARRLCANRRLLCAAPAYLERHGEPRSLEDLRTHRLLAAAGQLPWRLQGPQGRRLVAGDSHIRTNSSEVVRELALAGGGIALRSTWDVAQELRAGRLVRILRQYEGAADVSIHAVRPRAGLVSPAVRAFIDFLARLYAPVPPWERAGR